jgi:hypothetical protein
LAAVGPAAEGPTQELSISTGITDAGDGPGRLVQFDAMTLGDLDQPKELLACDVWQIQQASSFSADGSTAVTIEYSYPRVTATYDPNSMPDDAATVVVRDG